jgi:1,4-alpha-glucan branching enzyme
MHREPIHRQYHHNEITFRGLYAFTENFVLPLSHDEVVHGKGSLLSKMPGDEWQQFANLRLLYAYLFGQPGKKLLFMGGEWGQGPEWRHDASLDWHECAYPQHAGVLRLVADLGKMYRTEPALHEFDCRQEGFFWVDCSDNHSSVLSFLRKGYSSPDRILVVCNFTPVSRQGYRVGVPCPGYWGEVMNTDGREYGGGGMGNYGGMDAESTPWHGQGWSLNLTIPPLAAVFLKGGST